MKTNTVHFYEDIKTTINPCDFDRLLFLGLGKFLNLLKKENIEQIVNENEVTEENSNEL